MSRILLKNALGDEVAPAVALPRRRLRLSTLLERRVPDGFRPGQRPLVVSVHRAGDPIVVIDETVRLRVEWSTTMIDVGDIVLITVLPQGNGGGGNQNKVIGAALASIALTALAGPFGTAVSGALFGGSTLVANVIAAGVTIGGSYLLSLAARPKASQDAGASAYGVTGGGVLPRPGQRIPSIYGRTFTQPDLSQPDYMIYEGNDQILLKRVTVGLGRYTVHEIRTGDTVMWTAAGGVQSAFQGLEVDIINPGETTTLVPSNVISSSQVTNNQLPRAGETPEWSGPFVLGNPDQTYTRIQIDWSAPAGVYWRDGNGRIREAFVWCRWEYAAVNADGNPTGPWQVLLEFKTGYASEDPVRRTHLITVPSGRYAVRAKNMRPETNDTWTDDVTWDGLRAPLGDATVRPLVTEIALKIKAGPELGITTFSDILVEVTRILPVWNGAAWVEQETRKAVWAWVDILRNVDYGAGLATSAIDVGKALSYAVGVTEFDTFDGVIRGPVSVWEAASTVLFPLRAEPAFLGAVWSFTRDEPTAMRRTLFTRRQIALGTTRVEWSLSTRGGEADVIVSYYAGGDPKRPRETRNTIGQESLTPRRFELPGVTDYRHARHLAIWLSAVAAYRRKSISFETEMDGRLLTRGVPFGAEAWFETGQAVGVLSYGGTGNRTLTLTADVSLTSGDFIMLRDRRGRAWGPVQATVSSPRVIVLDATDVANVVAATGQSLTDVLESDGDMPSLMIRTGSTIAQDWLCQSVEPSGRDRVAIRGLLSANQVWTALGVSIPSIPNLPGPPTIPSQPALTWVRANPRQHTSSLEVVWSVSIVPGIRQVQVQISYDGTNWSDLFRGSATEGRAPLRMSADPVTVRARGFGAANAASGWVTATPFTTGTVSIPPIIVPPPTAIDLEALVPHLFRRLSELEARGREFSAGAADLLRSVWVAREQGEAALVVARRTLIQYTDEQTTALAAIIDQVQANLTALNGTVVGQATAISVLQTSVTNINGTLTSLSQSLTQLTTRVTDAENGIASNVTAINGLQTSVSTINGQLTSQGNQITDLEARLGPRSAVFAQAGQPSSTTIYDLWIRTGDSNRVWVRGQAGWAAVSGTNPVPTTGATFPASPAQGAVHILGAAVNNTSRPHLWTGAVWQDLTSPVDRGTASAFNGLQVIVTQIGNDLTTLAQQVTDLNAIVGPRSAVFAQSAQPASTTIYDLWIRTADSNRVWVRGAASWAAASPTNPVPTTGTTFPASPAIGAVHLLGSVVNNNSRPHLWTGTVWQDLTSPLVRGAASAFRALQVQVTDQGGQITALAQEVTDVGVRVNNASANGRFVIQAAADQSGVLSRIEATVRAADASWTASAAWQLEAALIGQDRVSQMVVTADRFFIRTSGTDRQQIFAASSSGVWITSQLFVGPNQKIVLDGVNGNIRILR